MSTEPFEPVREAMRDVDLYNPTKVRSIVAELREDVSKLQHDLAREVGEADALRRENELLNRESIRLRGLIADNVTGKNQCNEINASIIRELRAENERLKSYQNQHAGDCTFYSSVINRTCWDGICTCGYGWELWRKGVLDQMVSEERKQAIANDKSKDQRIAELERSVEKQCSIITNQGSELFRNRECIDAMAKKQMRIEELEALLAQGLGHVETLQADVASLCERNKELVEQTDRLVEAYANMQTAAFRHADRAKELEQVILRMGPQMIEGAQAATKLLFEQNQAMAKLLARLTHEYVNNDDGKGPVCLSDCPACARDKLLTAPAAQTPSTPAAPAAETKSPCPPKA